jgi:formylglycine-generating enzyme required for sulfatase activity
MIFLNSILLLLVISLLYSCNDTTVLTKSSSRGIQLVDIIDTNGSRILSYSGSYALLIGESDYTVGWQDLHSIPSELNDVENVLKSQGFVVERHSNLNSNELTSTFKNFIDKYGLDKNNRLLFFYSGHGHSRLNGNKGYIVPVDAPNPNLDDKGFVRKAVEMEQIVTWARRIESKHALFLFDSCFSGTVFKSKDTPVPKQISKASNLQVRQFITAGSADEVVPAKSTFTPAFVHALRYAEGDSNKDGYITGMELGLYLWNEVPKYTNQTPQYGKIRDFNLSRGDFVFKVGTKINVVTSNKVEEKPQVLELNRIKIKKLKTFQDPLKVGGFGPKMVWIPADSFRMGETTALKEGSDSDEKPVHRVSIGKFAIGKFEVTVGEFRKFVNVESYQTDAEKKGSCWTYKNNSWAYHKSLNWRNPNFYQSDNHPVVCVNWNDVTAYTKWLSNQTGYTYRIPTEAEWEYAARAGTKMARYWGNNPDKACNYANVADKKTKEKFDVWTIHNCRDGYVYTAPVGSFQANKFSLFDMLGNVWEWTCSKYENKYKGKEKRCLNKNNMTSVSRLSLRGGSWNDDAGRVRSANRDYERPSARGDNLGFRVVRISF